MDDFFQVLGCIDYLDTAGLFVSPKNRRGQIQAGFTLGAFASVKDWNLFPFFLFPLQIRSVSEAFGKLTETPVGAFLPAEAASALAAPLAFLAVRTFFSCWL